MENLPALPEKKDLEVLQRHAEILLKSGILPQSVDTPEKVIAITLKGRELGVPMMAALEGIDIIKGKPCVSPSLMLALARKTGILEDIRRDWRGETCFVTVKRTGQSPYTSQFGPKEARDMGLSVKDNYKKQAATMYEWRALAKALRWAFADTHSGLYTFEEMDPDRVVIDGAPALEDYKPTGPTVDVTPQRASTASVAQPPQAGDIPNPVVGEVQRMETKEKNDKTWYEVYLANTKFITWSETHFKSVIEAGKGAQIEILWKKDKFGYKVDELGVVGAKA